VRRLQTRRDMMKTISRAMVMAVLTLSFAASADDTATKTTEPAKPTVTKPATEKPAKAEKLKPQELQVMAHYHAVNKMEIDLGNAAAKKATRTEVKDYGKMLVEEHGKADKELLALAKKSGQVIPAEKPADATEKKEMADQKADATKLKTLKGADFEREYLRMMVQGHQKELDKLDANIAKAENADLVQSLKDKKAVLEHHRDEAKKLQESQPTASR
jgi:putative membrane protein